MQSQTLVLAIEKTLSETFNTSIKIKKYQAIGGGSINHSWKIQTNLDVYFIKYNNIKYYNMFYQEVLGLKAIAKSNTIQVPQIIAIDKTPQFAYLILEYLKLHPGSNASMGEKLAQMHSQEQAQWGWEEDNYIGSTSQPNSFFDDWIKFWREKRLLHQYHLAKQDGYTGEWLSQLERLIENFNIFFSTYQPIKSLLHGDLWGGNIALLDDMHPIVFDPAVYIGDREADLAMTELFGGFHSEFYAAYQDRLPLDSGYTVRKVLYNLYHILNHLHLFGSAYQANAVRMIEYLLSEL